LAKGPPPRRIEVFQLLNKGPVFLKTPLSCHLTIGSSQCVCVCVCLCVLVCEVILGPHYVLVQQRREEGLQRLGQTNIRNILVLRLCMYVLCVCVSVCVSLCVCVCVRACVRACM